jgi:pimeloyl-ACP methyl ester carboxylesterase
VLLVHGFLSTRSMMVPLQLALRRRGYEVHRAQLSVLCIQDVRLLAEQVAADVARLRGAGAEQVDLVGVSQGGLAALYFLRCLGGHTDVRRLVALGTPFHGTWAALAGLPALGLVSAGVWQSLPGSDLVSALRAAAPVTGEHVISVSREGDPVAPPERCALEGAENLVLPATWFPLVHQTLGFSPTVVRTVDRLLS